MVEDITYRDLPLEKCREVLKKLAAYHNAEYIEDKSEILADRGVFFRFKDGNETFAWDKLQVDWKDPCNKRLMPAYQSHPISDPRGLLICYITQHMFFRNTGCYAEEWCEDFNWFGPRMLKAGSIEELEMKLAIKKGL